MSVKSFDELTSLLGDHLRKESVEEIVLDQKKDATADLPASGLGWNTLG
jgi:hypothetical protein